jgi:hypothetical protein
VALLEYSSDSFQWNVSFARAAYDWEVDVFASFFNLLYSVRVRRDDVDKLWWSPPPKTGCLMLAPTIVSLLVTMSLISHGRVFGRQRFP